MMVHKPDVISFLYNAKSCVVDTCGDKVFIEKNLN